MKTLFIGAILALCLISTSAFASTGSTIGVQHTNGSFALTEATTIDARVLAANVAESETVPSITVDGVAALANYVVFSANCDFYVRMDGTAAVPSADITDGTASELNPTVRYLGGNVAAIGLKSASSCIVTMQFYR
jgi:hypothetical protein